MLRDEMNNDKTLDITPANVTIGSTWVDACATPFNRSVIEIVNRKGRFVEFKYIILNNKPWESDNTYSCILDTFHLSWIHPECEKAKANDMGLSLEDYRTFVAEQEHEEKEWQRYLREKRGHDKFYQEAPQ
jgi:hypothetical protein